MPFYKWTAKCLGPARSPTRDAPRVGLARLNPDRTLDRDFNIRLGVISLTMAADGKIVLVGSFSKINGVFRPLIARLQGELPNCQPLITRSGTSVNLAVPYYPGRVVHTGKSDRLNWPLDRIFRDECFSWRRLLPRRSQFPGYEKGILQGPPHLSIIHS